MGSKHPRTVFIVYDMGGHSWQGGTIYGNFTWSSRRGTTCGVTDPEQFIVRLNREIEMAINVQ